MAIDSLDKRASLLGYLQPYSSIPPIPDGAIDTPDRVVLLDLYYWDLSAASAYDNDRAAWIGHPNPFNRLLPAPDGSFNEFDRAHIIGLQRLLNTGSVSSVITGHSITSGVGSIVVQGDESAVLLGDFSTTGVGDFGITTYADFTFSGASITGSAGNADAHITHGSRWFNGRWWILSTFNETWFNKDTTAATANPSGAESTTSVTHTEERFPNGAFASDVDGFYNAWDGGIITWDAGRAKVETTGGSWDMGAGYTLDTVLNESVDITADYALGNSSGQYFMWAGPTQGTATLLNDYFGTTPGSFNSTFTSPGGKIYITFGQLDSTTGAYFFLDNVTYSGERSLTVLTGVVEELTGVESSGAIGTLSVTAQGSISTGLGGVESTSSVGTYTVNTASLYALTGVSGTGSAGSITVTTSGVSVSGIAGTGEAGDFTISASAIVSITGVQATSVYGDLSQITGFTVPTHPRRYEYIESDNTVESIKQTKHLSIESRDRRVIVE